jgi:23S rRNA (uracil1939-C5)-methyltransferase
MSPGDRLTLTAQKPAAGGRMIARHEGAVVLVAATIPGETVEAVVERVQRGTIWARTTRVIERSPDRVDTSGDGSCGGAVLAHVGYDRQLALKREIIRDAFSRIGRLSLPDDFPVFPSPVDGYRMRARLHVHRGEIGFFREGTHELCDPSITRQLLPDTIDSLHDLADALKDVPGVVVSEVEVAENCPATARALHLDLPEAADPSRLGSLRAIRGVTGVSCGSVRSYRSLVLSGSPFVKDLIALPSSTVKVSLTRHAHSFFQANRFLIADLLAAVVELVTKGRVLDLYAGVGLFAVALATRGTDVVAIEGERQSADDLKANAAGLQGVLNARHQAVETYLAVERPKGIETVIVDPPRTGLSKEALAGTIAVGAPRILYVSCDVATLARDAKLLVEAGYRVGAVSAYDLFPNTAHIESVVVFDR